MKHINTFESFLNESTKPLSAAEFIDKIKYEAGWFCMDVKKDKDNLIKWMNKNAGLFPDVKKCVDIIKKNDSWCTDNDDDLNNMLKAFGMPTDPDWEPAD